MDILGYYCHSKPTVTTTRRKGSSYKELSRYPSPLTYVTFCSISTFLYIKSSIICTNSAENFPKITLPISTWSTALHLHKNALLYPPTSSELKSTSNSANSNLRDIFVRRWFHGWLSKRCWRYLARRQLSTRITRYGQLASLLWSSCIPCISRETRSDNLSIFCGVVVPNPDRVVQMIAKAGQHMFPSQDAENDVRKPREYSADNDFWDVIYIGMSCRHNWS